MDKPNYQEHAFWCSICNKRVKGNQAEHHSMQHIKKGDFEDKEKHQKKEKQIPPPPNQNKIQKKINILENDKKFYCRKISQIDSELSKLKQFLK